MHRASIDGIKWNERPNTEGGSALVNNAAGGKEVGGRPIACLLAIVIADRADEMTREKVDSVQPLGIIRALSSLVGLPSGKSNTCRSLFLAVSSSMIKNHSEYIVLT